MSLRPDDVRLLRCEVNRIASLALSDHASMTPVDVRSGLIDQALIDACVDAVAFVTTMWQTKTLRAKGTYTGFNVMYDQAVEFLDDPSAAALSKKAALFMVLFACAAQLRGAPDPCGIVARVPGLWPPDTSIVIGSPSAPAEDVPEPAPPPPLRRRVYSEKFGYVVLGTAGLAATGLLTYALLTPSDVDETWGWE